MAETKKNLQSTRTMASLFGVTTRRVEQLKTEGIIQGEGRPIKYDLFPTVKSYIQYLSDKANGREKKATDQENESLKIEAEARFKQAKAEMEELKLQEFKGELHRAEDVEQITTEHVMQVRAMLMALPNKLAVDLAHISTAAEAAERIRKEVQTVLEDLSTFRYDKEAYHKRMRERANMQNKVYDEETP